MNLDKVKKIGDNLVSMEFPPAGRDIGSMIIEAKKVATTFDVTVQFNFRNVVITVRENNDPIE